MTAFDLGPADLADGRLRRTSAGELELGVARVGERWFVFETWCTHAECPLTDGWLEGAAVRCACHASLFDLTTGAPLEGPATEPIRTFPVRLRDGRVLADVGAGEAA
jgi:3-phenylpropionate/trans-cinnamate dioxygenase ferredoxin component